MRVIRELGELGDQPRRTVVTLGNFDGVHLAHQKILRRVVETARQMGATPAALTFEPHPTKVLSPERAPKLLTPLDLKTRLIERERIELLVILPFTRELAQLSPGGFVR